MLANSLSARIARAPALSSATWSLAVSATLSFAAAAVAQAGPPPIAPELRARFGFTGPTIVKIGDGIHGLRIADVDGDGKPEVVCVDPRRARLVALRWQGERFDLAPIPTDGQNAGYAIACARTAGVPDLLLVDGRGRLSLRSAKGDKSEVGIDLGLGGRDLGLLPCDLDRDGRDDLVCASRAGLRWITQLGGDQPVLSPIEPLEENVYDLHAGDLDGDGIADLAMIAPGPAMNLRLRFGRGDGTFGPWRIGNIEGLRHLTIARGADGAPVLATIEGPQRRVALHAFARDGAQAALEWWAFGENAPQGSKSLPAAVGDFDGDGDQDLVLAQGERARLLYFLWQQDTFVPVVVPTLAGITSLSAGDFDGDGKVDLAMVSPEEDALAWKSGALPLDAFPVRLPCVDKPVAVAITGDGGALVLARTEKRDGHIDRVTATAAPQKLLDTGRLPADPARLLVADVGDAPGSEVAFVVPSEGLRVLSLQAAPSADGDKPAEKNDKADKDKKAAGDIAGFTRKIDDGALGLTTHDGKPALVVVRDRFLRVFRIDGKGQVQVLEQDNGPEGTAELSLALQLPEQTRLYLDKKTQKLARARRGAPITSTDVPPFEFTQLLAHGDAALLLSPRGLLRVPFGKGPSLRTIALHEPPTERTAYRQALAGDFDHDGIADLALIDGNLPGVQILAGGRNGDGKATLQRALAMPVFEAPPSAEPADEPREFAVGDLDGDGRDDLALIAHDRVLVYLQQK